MGTIYRIKERARRVVGIENEYLVRRGVQRLFHRGEQTKQVRIHASARKAASQFIRLFLSDPRICLKNGMEPYFLANSTEKIASIEPSRCPIVCSYYGSPTVRELPTWEGYDVRMIYVGRNPQSCFNSWLRSTFHRHPATYKVKDIRARMEQINDHDQLVAFLLDSYQENENLIQEWLGCCEDGKATFVPFENVTSDDPIKSYNAICKGLNIEYAPDRGVAILRFYGKLLKSSGGKYSSHSKNKESLDPQYAEIFERIERTYENRAAATISRYDVALKSFMANPSRFDNPSPAVNPRHR